MSPLARATREKGRPTVTLPGGFLYAESLDHGLPYPEPPYPGRRACPPAVARAAGVGDESSAARTGVESSVEMTLRTAREDLR